jgi:hypothetical protein
VLNPAVVPGRPSEPKIVLNIAISLVIGTMLGIAIVMLLEIFDRRVRSRGDLALDVPLLGALNTWQPPQGRLLGPPSGGAGRALPESWLRNADETSGKRPADRSIGARSCA